MQKVPKLQNVLFFLLVIFSATKHRDRGREETYGNICQDRNLEGWVRGRWDMGQRGPLKRESCSCWPPGSLFVFFFFSAKATKYEVQSFSEPIYVFVKKGHNYQGLLFQKKEKKKKKSRELNMSSMWDNQLDQKLLYQFMNRYGIGLGKICKQRDL